MVHRTGVIKNTLDPEWEAFEVPLHMLCDCDLDK